jgi:hypothetical protein
MAIANDTMMIPGFARLGYTSQRRKECCVGFKSRRRRPFFCTPAVEAFVLALDSINKIRSSPKYSNLNELKAAAAVKKGTL